MSKGKLRIHMSLMIMANSGRYNILKGTVFDLMSFSVIKIATSGSNWKFETNKKSGLIFSFFFLLAWLLLYSRNDFLFVLFAGFGTNWRLIPAYYRKVLQVSKTRQFFYLFIYPSDMNWVPSLCQEQCWVCRHRWKDDLLVVIQTNNYEKYNNYKWNPDYLVILA